jgi:hypothetical protein
VAIGRENEIGCEREEGVKAAVVYCAENANVSARPRIPGRLDLDLILRARRAD